MTCETIFIQTPKTNCFQLAFNLLIQYESVTLLRATRLQKTLPSHMKQNSCKGLTFGLIQLHALLHTRTQFWTSIVFQKINVSLAISSSALPSLQAPSQVKEVSIFNTVFFYWKFFWNEKKSFKKSADIVDIVLHNKLQIQYIHIIIHVPNSWITRARRISPIPKLLHSPQRLCCVSLQFLQREYTMKTYKVSLHFTANSTFWYTDLSLKVNISVSSLLLIYRRLYWPFQITIILYSQSRGYEPWKPFSFECYVLVACERTCLALLHLNLPYLKLSQKPSTAQIV